MHLRKTSARAPALAILLTLFTFLVTADALAEPPLQVEEGIASSHRLGSIPRLRVAWQDLTIKDRPNHWLFRLTVDPRGHVSHAAAHDTRPGPVEYRQQAEELARALRFTPFERDGRPVAAEFNHWVLIEVEDYIGPSQRNFPTELNPLDVSIALRRTGCYGTCPSYWLELRGDGLVTYWGFAFVAEEGRRQWRVAPAAVAALVEQFRKADYFKLKKEYIATTTDLPTYITRLSLGAQQKFVVDYGGRLNTGEALPAERRGTGPYMPRSVADLEDAIDAVAGSASRVGNVRTPRAMARP